MRLRAFINAQKLAFKISLKKDLVIYLSCQYYKGKMKQKAFIGSQKLRQHPLYMDSYFVPKGLKYVLFKKPSNFPENPPGKIVVPYHDEETTFLEL